MLRRFSAFTLFTAIPGSRKVQSWSEPTSKNPDICAGPRQRTPTSLEGLTDSGFRDYASQDGPLPDLTNVEQNFLEEVSRYITANKLVGLIGLQVLGDGACNTASMSELILGQGTNMLDTSLVEKLSTDPCHRLGVRIVQRTAPGLSVQRDAFNETSWNHKVFNAGKPLARL
ncbi:hypothetical protein GE09DRAFT_1222230 [Coniochaeta sp. 2T2.1]|nr:hypothetical protein GE09DRAFT_1222230 [Coniochaeta sp. 2T2.1]